MVSITLSVPIELKKEMDAHPDINWSSVARESIKKKLFLLEKFRKFTENSNFSEEDALFYGKKLNKKLSKKS